jgi:hypothetical protein
MIAYNVLFYFIPKELLHIKNNGSEYELNITAALGMLYIHLTPFKHPVMKTYGEVDM